jgi:hypothetical protein
VDKKNSDDNNVLTNLLSTASSNSCGLLVAPMIITKSSGLEVTPSNWIRNSDFSLLLASFSLVDLVDIILSI